MSTFCALRHGWSLEWSPKNMEASAKSTPEFGRTREITVFRPRGIGTWLAVGCGVLYLLFCVTLYFGIERPFSLGTSNVSIEADSGTYFAIAASMASNATQEVGPSLISLGGNLLGPIILARLLPNTLLVAIFNAILFACVVSVASHIPGLRRGRFLLLLMLDPATLSAIVTLNKEIFAAAGMTFFIASRLGNRHKKLLLVASLIFSLFARWQQVIVLLMVIALDSRHIRARRKPYLTVGGVILVLTIAYGVAIRILGLDISTFLIQNTNTTGPIARMAEIQASFGYPLVLLPKAMLNLINKTLYLSTYYSTDISIVEPTDLQNRFISPSHCIAMAIILLSSLLTRRLFLFRLAPFVATIYLCVTCLSPFIQPRYQYPTYALLCIELSRRKDSLNEGPLVERRVNLVRLWTPVVRQLDARTSTSGSLH